MMEGDLRLSGMLTKVEDEFGDLTYNSFTRKNSFYAEMSDKFWDVDGTGRKEFFKISRE